MLLDLDGVMWQIIDEFMLINQWSQTRHTYWASYGTVRGKTMFGGCLQGEKYKDMRKFVSIH